MLAVVSLCLCPTQNTNTYIAKVFTHLKDVFKWEIWLPSSILKTLQTAIRARALHTNRAKGKSTAPPPPPPPPQCSGKNYMPKFVLPGRKIAPCWLILGSSWGPNSAQSWKLSTLSTARLSYYLTVIICTVWKSPGRVANVDFASLGSRVGIYEERK